MSIWFLLVVLQMACWAFVGLIRMRPCGCLDAQRYMTCTRTHFRRCYVKWVDYGEVAEGMMRWGKTSEEHVWTTEEYLARFEGDVMRHAVADPALRTYLREIRAAASNDTQGNPIRTTLKTQL